MKKLLYPLYILLIVIVLIPKERLYFTLESLLATDNIFISNETFVNRFVYLNIENSTLMLDNLSLATIEEITLSPWVIHNRLTVSSITFSPLYRTFFPGKIDTLSLTYSLYDPLFLRISGEGDFGRCSGNIDLIDQRIRIVFEALPQLRRYPLLLAKLHKTEEGLVYESAF